MDNSYQAQAMVPIYYYNSDLKADNNSHSCFTSSQSNGNQASLYHQEVEQPSLSSSFSLSHSSSSPLPMTPQTYHSGFHPLVHHMDSTVPLYSKTYLNQDQAPRMIIESGLPEAEYYGYPSTPPLSATSISSSPYIYNGLPTSLNAPLMGMDNLKDDCGAELTHGEWIGCGSPPVTPVFIQPHSLTGNPSEIIPTQCPFLSPSSPTPYSQPSAPNHQDFDFCDPRHITVIPGSQLNHPLLKSAPATAYTPLSNLYAVNEDDLNKVSAGQGDNLLVPNIQKENCGQLSLQSMSSSFEQYPHLQSDEVLTHGVSKFGPLDNSHLISKRRRSASSNHTTDACNENFDIVDDLSHYEDLNQSDDLASAACPLSPPISGSELKDRRDRRGNKMKKSRNQDRAEFSFPLRSHNFTTFMNSNEVEATSASNDQSDGSSFQAGASEPNIATSASNQDGNSARAPVTRRGRKQSLTEDLTKTFVCDLCNRRFRRQEHLKRHYRSLHTSDKPYECNHCAKKFSRSDNLTQHLRTHGSAISVGCIEDGSQSGQLDVGVQHVHELGSALFVAAADAPGSDSEGTSRASSDYDSMSRKKRKRSE